MMKTLAALFLTLSNCLWWALVFLVCRVLVRLAERPAWHTIPLALAIGAAWLALRALAQRRARHRGENSGSAPALRARMRLAWRRGRALRGGSLFRPAPPVLLFLNLVTDAPASPLELADAADSGISRPDDEFTWRQGDDAAWIDCPPALYCDDDRWPAFAATAGRHGMAGVAVALDAGRLAAAGAPGASLLRQRLEALQEKQKQPLPVYLVIDNVDRLYGLRSLVSRIAPERLAAPMGDLRHPDREKSPAFFRRVLAGCVAAIVSRGDHNIAPGPAAVLAPEELLRLEAPLVQFCRQVFGKKDDDRNPRANRSRLRPRSRPCPWIRGLFLAASNPGGGDAVPSVLSRLESFAAVHETLAVQPWFLAGALGDAIPADARPAAVSRGAARRPLLSGPVTGFALGILLLSLFMTWSFLDSRTILLSARGRAATPETAESLEPYLELAALTRSRAENWRLPRFGMTEARDLADVLRRRYTESYFDIKTIPSIEYVQDAAILAADSDSPAEIGNALLLLAVAREGIARNIDASGGGQTDQTRFLHALVLSLRLATPADMRQMETYFAWAGRQDWMPETRDALEEFEKYVVDNAAGGDLTSWLAEWVNSLPDPRAVDTARVWDAPLAGNSTAIIDPAWTREGYAVARGLLEAVSCGPQDHGAWREKRDAALEQYRLKAVEHWRAAADGLWSKFRRRIPDSEAGAMLRAALRGDDPASRFLALLRHHVMYMFAGDDAAGNPDAAWLFLHGSLTAGDEDADGVRDDDGGPGGLAARIAGAVSALGSDDSLDQWSRELGLASGDDDRPARDAWARWRGALRRHGLVAESPAGNFAAVRGHFRAGENDSPEAPGAEALLQAGREAEFLHRHLREKTGTSAWDSLSPLAVHDYIRYLATRQAALHLDALWREDVYNPAHLAAGSDGDRLGRLAAGGGPLEQFLTGTASGFWLWDGSALANASWRRLPFMFDDEFLDFCRTALRERRPGPPEALELPLSVQAVDVDRGAVERPVTVEFVLENGGESQSVSFNNYSITESFHWQPGRGEASAEIRVHFPSVKAVVRFEGTAGVENLVSALSAGELHLEAGLFPEAEPVLRRMGVTTIVVKASLENGREFVDLLREKPLTLPRSVITPGPAGADVAAAGAAPGLY